MGNNAVEWAMNSKIPIANIYYIYLYAWERFREGSLLTAGAEDSPDLPNLLAKVLLKGMHSLLRRGLDREYLSIEDEIATVRGRVDINRSLHARARNVQRNYCSFDEFSHDVIHNQILKSSLKRLCKYGQLDSELLKQCRSMLLRLHDISDVKITQSSFSQIRLHRNNSFYDLLIRTSQLIHSCLMPSQNSLVFKYRDILRDEREMAHVFEAFVRNFYKIEQSRYSSEPLGIPWDSEALREGDDDRLPNMRVDVFLKSEARQIIIDTKYYAEALQSYHGSSSFRSGHLYQLFSYLKNHQARINTETRLDGKLIYPQTGPEIDAIYRIQGHEVQIATLDLMQPWMKIRERLLRLINVEVPSIECQ